MGDYLVVFLVAAGATFTITPVVRRIAIRWGVVVAPDARRVHERPTPELGGVAMFVAFLLAMAVAWRMGGLRDVFAGSSEPLGVVVGASVMFGVGLLDDLREWSAPAKLSGMVLAASLMQLLGVTMFYFRIPFAELIVLSPDMAFLVGVVWVVGMANAVNLIDGLDGLAAGIVAIAAGAFFLYGQRLSDVGLLEPGSISPLLAIIVLGLCLGFLPHNFHPARIFMGDSGALMLGLLLAASTMVVGGRTAEPFSGQTYFFFAPLFIPLVVLGVPIIDTVFAIVRRATRRTGVAVADKDHLHHRLMRLGHGHRRSVLILWAWTAILSGFVLYPTYAREGDALVPFGIAALALALFTLFHPGLRRAREAAGPGGGPGPGGPADPARELAAPQVDP
ncbi:MAG: undecaprenyl/decaprenyl-phosphate alpha-N-acetylglucosaminyl 1-phosphate transferase [Acidimicrobiales bacterium]|nr:undecaprenyl/decaprenyl-phosphate alpha-N-acetylglucosaminyl 1-phosphate transferase [Acidimicrobiales bacterium]